MPEKQENFVFCRIFPLIKEIAAPTGSVQGFFNRIFWRLSMDIL